MSIISSPTTTCSDIARATSACVRWPAPSSRPCVAAPDIVTRYGGEEFAVLVPGLSPEDTEALGERIRAAVEARAIPHPRARGATVTISVGTAASIPDGADALDRLINDADGALYRSKHLGRNRVTLAGATGSVERPDEAQSAA